MTSSSDHFNNPSATRQQPPPVSVYACTREGFLAAFRHQLLREPSWHENPAKLDALISNAERTLRSNMSLWRHDTSEAERAYADMAGEVGKPSLRSLRALPSGDVYRRFSISINQHHVRNAAGFCAWLEQRGHEVRLLMRYRQPSGVDGVAVRIGHHPKRERSGAERVIDCLYAIYAAETASGELS